MTDDKPSPDIASFLVSSIHDMKNSLSVMTDHLEQTLRTDQPPSPGRSTAQALYEAQRIDDNLLQLLTLFQLDRDAYPFDPREHLVADFCRELLDRVASLAAQRDIRLSLECPAESRWWFDADLVSGAILRALHNALIYTRGRILLSVSVREEMLEIRVEDDGTGYPETLLKQGGAIAGGACPEAGGTGLGLYYSGVVARLHAKGEQRGMAWLENHGRLGGSVFALRLP